MREQEVFDADFTFTFDLLAGFFKQGRTQRALNAIHETEVTGWEKWWQIELVLYASEHDEIGDWDMEEPFYTDRRMEKQKDIIAVDFCFRRKSHSRDSMIFVELKQNADWRLCINNMMSDAQKINKSQVRSHNNAKIRNFFVAGVYPSEPKAEVHDYVFERADKLNIGVDCVDTKFIPNTDYSFTLF
jgi:hypothetical protein